MGTRIIVFRALCCIEKSLLTEMIRSDFFVKLFYFLSASSTATATATVAPTMGEKCWDSISEGIEANRRWRFATLPMGAGKKQITS